MAEKTLRPFKAVFAICPFVRNLDHHIFDSLNTTFVHPAFNWQAVRQGARTIICYAGDNDPYVPISYSQEVADALDTQLIIIEKGGHLNAEACYFEFPALLDKIQRYL